MAKLIALTVAEFVNVLRGGVKHHFGGMVGVTIPKLTVKDRNDHDRTWAVAFPGIDRKNVRKVMHGAILVGPDYMKQLEKELLREGKTMAEHTSSRPVWHEAVEGTRCLRRHKKTGELYFWVAFVQKTKKPDGTWVHLKPKTKYVDISTGDTIPRESLYGFTDPEKLPTNQGVDSGREIIVRTYKLESVRNLVVDGKVYSLVTK